MYVRTNVIYIRDFMTSIFFSSPGQYEMTARMLVAKYLKYLKAISIVIIA